MDYSTIRVVAIHKLTQGCIAGNKSAQKKRITVIFLQSVADSLPVVGLRDLFCFICPNPLSLERLPLHPSSSF
jgi:hypothetical protein